VAEEEGGRGDGGGGMIVIGLKAWILICECDVL